MQPRPDKRREVVLPRRVLFLNDVGFQYGAGVAQARQVEAFLALGIEVGVLAWAVGDIPLEKVATRPIDADLWLGIREVNHLEGGKQLPDDAGLLMEIARFKPEVVLVGNLHAARWPFALLPAIRAIGCRVICFLHDAFLYTGRCAYPGACRLYLHGCDATCPTAGEYPALAPDRIAAAWQARREIFGGPSGIEVIANSRWNQRMFQTALPAGRQIETIELSANEDIFRPGDKTAARARLGLPEGKPIVLCAAVNFQEKRKGCEYLREIIAALRDEVTFAAFGHNAGEIPGLIGLGYHLSATNLALAYQAADLFLGTATEEAFGQTIMEAQLCGLPVVAFQVGGVEEIVRNEITGKLVRNGNVAETVAAIRLCFSDPRFLTVTGPWARQYALNRFSMWGQEDRWHVYLAGRTLKGTGHCRPELTYPLVEEQDSRIMEQHRPSWTRPVLFLSPEHEGIFQTTQELPGWQVPGDSFKLYELGYYAGDVILEIGTFGGRSATLLLLGALANRERTLPPQYYGIDIMDASIVRTRQILADGMLGHHCHLHHGDLAGFVTRWQIRPTVVFLDGDHTYAGVAADLAILNRYLTPGTPVLIHDFLNRENHTGVIGVQRAALEWEAAGGGEFLGCFGCSALYLSRGSRQSIRSGKE